MAAPTALSLIAVTFPEGRPRNRAVAVYSAMAILGIVVGLIAGGLLVTYASWRWVLFVNVPIGLVVAALATRVLPQSGRRAGRFDLPGAVTATAGVAAAGVRAVQRGDHPGRRLALGRRQGGRVAGRRRGAAGGVRGDRDPQQDPLLPFRVLRSRDRSGAYLISLCVGTALLGMFFFLTLFIQDVWGYSALKTGVAYLPFVPVVLATTVVAQQGVTRIGARPLLIAGSALGAGGMFWLSRITEHSTFAGGMLGPEMVLGAGLGPLFVLIFLVGLTKVRTTTPGWRPAWSTSGSRSAARSGSPPTPGRTARTTSTGSCRATTTGSTRPGRSRPPPAAPTPRPSTPMMGKLHDRLGAHLGHGSTRSTASGST